jgi:hypothetical protein
MKSARIALLAVTLVALVAAMPAAHAQAVSVCQFTTHVTITPGAGTTPSAGTFTTNGETGTIECVGDLAGTGTIGYEGTFGDLLQSDTCAFGEGSGTFSYTIGETNVHGTFHYVRVAVAGIFGGPTSDGGSYGGAFEFAPDAGQDCVTSVTGATVTGQAVLAY